MPIKTAASAALSAQNIKRILPLIAILTFGVIFLRTHCLKRILAAILALAALCCMLPGITVSATKGDTLRIGVSELFGIYKENNKYTGFAYDYLNAMQVNTGHRYVFVEASPDELMQMLSEGLIDVIPCVTKEEYEYWSEIYFNSSSRSISDNVSPQLCGAALMKKYTAIYVKENSDISFFDLDALNQATIGYHSESAGRHFASGTFVRGEIDRANFVEYETEAQMKNDFNSGKIDAVLKCCFCPWEDEKIVYQYSTQDCYMLISGSDPQLKSELDVAVNATLMADSSFAANAYARHVEKYGSQGFAFSSAEKSFIESNPTITIAYNESASSIENYDSATNTITGYTGEVLQQISEMTGLTLKIRPCHSLSDCAALLANGEADVICGGANSANVAEYGSFSVSFPFASVPIVTVGRSDTALNGSLKIAIPFSNTVINEYAASAYSSAALLPYDSTEECILAVENGTADIACTDLYEAVYVLGTKSNGLTIIKTSTTRHDECFVYSASATELRSIFGKCIASLTSTEYGETYQESIAAINDLSGKGTVPVEIIYTAAAVLAVLAVAVVLAALIAHSKARRLGDIDPLTGGRNKQKFIEDTKKLFKKDPTDKWAIALLDINKFKFINDRLGYEEGDRMLERLYRTISDAMNDDEVCARISDDNFACTIRAQQDSDITARLNSIFEEFERRNNMFVKYSVIFSTGVCRLYQCRTSAGEADVNTALDRCTIAKKTLKGLHYSSIAFYDGKIRDKALREKDYENIMPTALAHHEFQCYLQPKYGLKSRRIEGAEALIRWNSKEFGFVFPNEFIPISEKNGFVVELDFFILEEVCKAIRRWLDEGKTPVVISVNQSKLHLNYDNYIWRLREIVDKYEVPYEYIELEITESVFMEDTEKLLTVVQKLHDIGFKLSLDDFGSGYSSLNMLKDIPVDVVKIDREFFNGTVNSEKGRAVISTVVDLAKNLDMQVISEGVETIEQVEFLTEINCNMVQGYYFAKPMPMQAFEELWNKELEESNN